MYDSSKKKVMRILLKIIPTLLTFFKRLLFPYFLVRAFSEAPPPNRQLASAQRPPLDSADSGRVRPPPSRQLAVAFSADSAPLVLSKRRRSLRLVLWERPQPRRSVRPQQVLIILFCFFGVYREWSKKKFVTLTHWWWW